jgi:hypothetical protein
MPILTLKCRFTAHLKSREEVSATVFFRLQTRTFFRPEGAVKMELSSLADATVSRWALQFASADDAVDDSAFDSLASALRGMTGETFNISRAVVSEIIPLSPPLPRPDPPKEPRHLRFKRELQEDGDAYEEALKLQRDFSQAHPFIEQDPHHKQRLLNRFENFFLTILSARRGL